MGSLPSQLKTSSLRVVNKLPEDGGDTQNSTNGTGPAETQPPSLEREVTTPKLLVSIVDRSTVIISEARSVCTQTDELDTGKVDGNEKNEVPVVDEVCNDHVSIPGESNASDYKNTAVVESRETSGVENKRNNEDEMQINETEGTNGDREKACSSRTSETSDVGGNVQLTFNSEVDTTPVEETEHKRKVVWEESEATIDVDNYSITTHEQIDTEKCYSQEQNQSQHEVKQVLAFGLSPPTEVPFEEIALNRYGKYKVRLQSDQERCVLSAAVFLETGDAIVVDRSNQKVKYVDSKFQFISSHELPAQPWAVCARGTDVYVSMGHTQIQHLTVQDMIIEPAETFEIKGRCLGVCVYGEHLAVGLQAGEICLLNFKGEAEETIKLPQTDTGSPCNPWHLFASKQDNILVTDSDVGAVYCVNKNSEVIFAFRGLSSPRATAVDYHGNILVVGRDMTSAVGPDVTSGAVVVVLHRDAELLNMLHIDADTKVRSRVLLTWDDLEFVPYCSSCRRDSVVILGGIQESLKIMILGLPEPEEESDTETS